jgi:hypothetical protein
MIEGLLYASATPGGYAIGKPDGSNLARGQAIELYLAGQWIAGHVSYSNGYVDPSQASSGDDLSQPTGAYHIADDEVDDSVTEASEESFPASDPHAWPTSHQGTDRIVNGPYFVVDRDGTICGLCIGMRVRTQEA